MTHIEAIRDVLLTTESTVLELASCLSQIDSDDEKQLVFKGLSKDFDILYKTYIKPVIEVREDKFAITIYPRYKKNEDDLYLDEETYKDPIWFEREVTANWLKRKKDELNAIDFGSFEITSPKLNNIDSESKEYSTYQLNNATEDEIKALYRGLIKINVLNEDTNPTNFIETFSEEHINYQPRFIIKATKQVLCYLLINLMELGQLDEDIDYNSININSVIFIKSNGKEFSELKSNFNIYKSYPLDKFKSKKKVKAVNKLLLEIFG